MIDFPLVRLLGSDDGWVRQFRRLIACDPYEILIWDHTRFEPCAVFSGEPCDCNPVRASREPRRFGKIPDLYGFLRGRPTPSRALSRLAGRTAVEPYAIRSSGLIFLIRFAAGLCSASHRSWASCMLSHTSGLVRRALDKRSAVSVVTLRLPLRISFRRWRAMPSRLAKSCCVMPLSSRMIRNATPGCAGRRFFGSVSRI